MLIIIFIYFKQQYNEFISNFNLSFNVSMGIILDFNINVNIMSIIYSLDAMTIGLEYIK